MKKIIYPAIITVFVIASAFTFIQNSNWKVKEDAYSVKFSGKKVDGIFKGLKSDIAFDENNPANSKISASIDATTVNTGNGMKNKHTQQALGTDQYPQIKFQSTAITKKGEAYEAKGNLTIKDVTKEIILPFTFTKTADGGIFTGNFSVAPIDYHVDKSGMPDLIEIRLDIPVTK